MLWLFQFSFIYFSSSLIVILSTPPAPLLAYTRLHASLILSSLSIFSSISDIFRLFSFPLSNRLPYVCDASSQIRFNFTSCQVYVWNIHFKLTLWIVQSFPKNFFSSVLWPLLTSHSSLLLQISLPVRPHGINQCSFLVYPPELRIKVTVTFWTSLRLANLSA